MAWAAQNWGNQLAVICIDGYQKHLSPRKGWNCAHRVLHGGPSCSQWVKGAIGERGCRAAFSLAPARFAECKSAAQILRATAPAARSPSDWDESATEAKSNRKRKRRDDGCDDCDWCDLPCDLACFHAPSACGRGPLARVGDAACDCGPGDTGCVDCSSCACFP